MWLIFTIESNFHLDFGVFGIHPRTFSGLIGILFAPLIHGDALHLASNSFPLIFLGSTLYLFYNRIASAVFMQCYFLPNVLVWIFGRNSYHIGASGLIYGLAFFLIAFGFFRKDSRSILISLVIILMYGGLIWGVIPTQNHVSWESHLMGAIVGIVTAATYKKLRIAT